MLLYFSMMLLRRLPMLLVLLGGIMFSIVRWKRHPRVSLMTILGLGFFLIEIFIYAAVLYWMPSLRESIHISFRSFNYVYTVLHVLDDFAYAAVVVLLVAAAFTGRRGTEVINP